MFLILFDKNGEIFIHIWVENLYSIDLYIEYGGLNQRAKHKLLIFTINAPQCASHILSKPSSLIVDRRLASFQCGFAASKRWIAASNRCLATSFNASFCFRVLPIAFSFPRNLDYFEWILPELMRKLGRSGPILVQWWSSFCYWISKKRLNSFIDECPNCAKKLSGNMQISTHNFQWIDLKLSMTVVFHAQIKIRFYFYANYSGFC